MTLAQRNLQIVEMLRDLNISVASIAAKYGLSEEMVRRIGRDNGVPPRKKGAQRRRVKLEHQAPISPLHQRIGVFVGRHRAKEQLSPKEFATNACMSVERLRSIELGCHAQLTLIELQNLATAIGCEVGEITSYKAVA